jgi:hypothetical protein
MHLNLLLFSFNQSNWSTHLYFIQNAVQVEAALPDKFQEILFCPLLWLGFFGNF